MADFTVKINLEAHDLNTRQVIRGIRGNLRGLSGEIDTSLGGNGKGRGSRAFDQLGAGLTRAGSAMNQLAASGRGVLDPIIDEGVTFERAMAEVLAFGGTKFAPFMDQLHAQARQLGRDTEFTGVQAAASMRQLAQAGLEPNEIMEQLPTIMDLAKAGAMDLAPAAKIVASTMAQFAGSGESAANVADILAKTANSTQTDVASMGRALDKTGSSADLLGLTVEQTSVLLGGLGKSAISGGTAGRQLQAVFVGMSRLTNPSLRRALKGIGIDQKTLVDNLAKQDISGVIRQFREGFAAKGLDGPEKAARRMEVLTKIFGRIGSRGFLALAKAEETGKLAELAAEVHEFGGAAKMMGDIMSETARGDIKRMESALSELKLTVADELLPAIKPLIEDVTGLAKEFSEWSKENPEMVRNLGMMAVKGTALASALGPLLIAGGSAITVFSTFGKVAKWSSGSQGMGALVKAIPALSKNLGTLTGSAAGFSGMLGGAAAAGALGVAFGLWLDDTFKISSGISGLNTEMSIHNRLMADGISLQLGLSRIRGAAKLGDMTEQEREQIKTAQAAKDRLSAELADIEGKSEFEFNNNDRKIANFFGGNYRTSEDVQGDIQKQQSVIDRINERAMDRAGREAERAVARAQGGSRPAQADNTQQLLDAVTKSHFGGNGGTIKVIVDQDNRFIGVEGVDQTGTGNGTMLEGQ